MILLALLLLASSATAQPRPQPRAKPDTAQARPRTPARPAAGQLPACARGGGDCDCRHFASQREAQAFFRRMGGPERDPHSLDADGDGIACESLRRRRSRG
jgi:hypothetical protein